MSRAPCTPRPRDDLRPSLRARRAALRRARARTRRAGRARTRGPWGRRLTLLLPGLAAGLAGFALGSWPAAWAPGLAGQALPLRQIRISGLHHLEPQAVALAAELAPGAPLLALDRQALARRIESQAWIRRARVLPLPPNTLLIGVEERQPEAVARVSGRRGATLVDRDAVPFAPAAEAETRGLPALELTRPAARGEPDPRLRLGLRLAHALATRDLPAPAAVRLEGHDPAAAPVLELRGLEGRIVLGSGELASKLDRLAVLLQSDRPEVRQAEWIDLRFADRAVLRSETSRTGTKPVRQRSDGRRRQNREPSG